MLYRFLRKTKLYNKKIEIILSVCTVFFSEFLKTYLYLLFHLKQRTRHFFWTVKEGSHFRKLEDFNIMAHLSKGKSKSVISVLRSQCKIRSKHRLE